VSGLFTRLSATRWKLAVLRGLGKGEIAVIFKAAAFSASTLPKVVAVSIT